MAVAMMACAALLFLPGMLVPAQAQQIEKTEDGWVYHWDPEIPVEGGDPLPSDPSDPERFGGPSDVDGGVTTTTPEPTSLALAVGGALVLWMCGMRRR
jgi:hypothetical protein